jgi:predicted RNase H-like HicB family nuclease
MPVTDFNEKAIESEVFRFVSVRNPQRITKIQHKRIAALYDTSDASDFYDDLVSALGDPSNETEAAKLAAVKTLATTFKAGDSWLASIASLETLLPAIVDLYDWLQTNITTLTVASFTAKVTGIEISGTDRKRIWDNLFAHMILGGEGALRTSMIEALVIDHLLNNYEDEEVVTSDDDLRLMVNAKIVLPDEIFPLPATNTSIPVITPPEIEDSSELEGVVSVIKSYETAIAALENILDRLIEERKSQLIDPSVEPIVIDESSEAINPDYVLTEALIDGLSEAVAGILTDNDLGDGSRLYFCIEVLEKKTQEGYRKLFESIELGQRVLMTGGGIWSPARFGGGREACDPATLPDVESAEDYDGFYYGDAKCRIKPLGIGDLLKVEQKLCCYAPGEVAHIENVMQGEYKERATRRLRRTEDTFVSITEKETSNERDTITTEQYEMERATSSVIQDQMSFDAGVTVSADFGATSLVLNSNFATSTSTNTATSQATSFARNITDRALSRVIERTHEERIRKIIDEYEETNKHGFDNRGGAEHVVGLYRWADKIYENKLVNYGKRLMFELMIPEPAAFHLWAMQKPSAANSMELVEPIDPRSSRVSEFGYGLSPLIQIGIYRQNYYHWGAAYGVTLDPPPPRFINVTATRSAPELDSSTPYSLSWNDIKIPQNYKAIKAYTAVAFKQSQSVTGWVLMQVGHAAPVYRGNTNGRNTHILDEETETVSLSVIGQSPQFAINIVINCRVFDEHVVEWQRDCYGKILDAYFQKKAAYDQALAQAKAGYGNGIFGTNPAMNREIEQNELKKGCLNALFYGAGFNSDAIDYFPEGTDCDPPQTVVNCCTLYEGQRAKFLEQVFDWKNMTYLFYPYFHGQKCRWKMLYQLQDADTLFLKFLQAGMARVVLPVRVGFEEAAMYFLRTGQIWGGGPVPAIKSDLYMSITQELMGAVLNTGTVAPTTWETRVPTTLTVLQCGSGCITGDGLPCECGTGIGAGTAGAMTPGTGDPVLPGTGH